MREESGEEGMPGRVTELLEALQRMPIGFGMARRTRDQVMNLIIALFFWGEAMYMYVC